MNFYRNRKLNGSRALLTLILGTLIIASCSGNDKSNPDSSASYPRSVNTEEAQIFSKTLNENYNMENSYFTASSANKQNQTFEVKGQVDWIDEKVFQEIDTDLSGGVDLTNICFRDEVFESFTGLHELLLENGHESKSWVKRELFTQTYRSDVLCTFIVQLYSNTIENPVLIRQDGTQILGTKDINGEEALIFERSGKVKYFVAQDSTLLRLEVSLSNFSETLQIDFFNSGQAEFETPTSEETYDIDEVFNLFAANRPGF